MKITKLIYPLALALAVTLAGAGCKHPAPKTTPLPASPTVGDASQPQTQPTFNPQPQPGPSQPIQLPTAPPIVNQGDVNSTNIPGMPIAENSNWDPRDYVADPAALAADTVHFAFDSAVVRASEQTYVQAVAAYLTANPNDKLMIEGNCDERGTEEYNRSLGERRALALREALSALKIETQRVRTISYGKDKPVDPGHDEAAWSKNRRGDFVIYHPKTGV
jgi:peptidoglycan-associated lipoprotein